MGQTIRRAYQSVDHADLFSPWQAGSDAVFYVAFQFLGGFSGAVLAAAALSPWVSHPTVRYAVTTPGPFGPVAAFVAEAVIAFVLMAVVLHALNDPRLQRFTGVCAGVLVAAYITLEAPISGMSMNPARTLASALAAQHSTALWIYLALLSSACFQRQNGTLALTAIKPPAARCLLFFRALRHAPCSVLSLFSPGSQPLSSI